MPTPPSHFPVKFKFSGVDMRAAVDQLGPGRFRVAKNVKPTAEGSLTVREGTIALNASPLAELSVFTLSYLADPVNNKNILIAGAGESLYNLELVSEIDTGYSGDPLTEVDYRLSN